MRGRGLRPWGVMRCGRGLRTTHYIVQPRLTIYAAKICSFSVFTNSMHISCDYTFYLFRILSFRLELRRPPDVNREAVILIFSCCIFCNNWICRQLSTLKNILYMPRYCWLITLKQLRHFINRQSYCFIWQHHLNCSVAVNRLIHQNISSILFHI